MGIADCADCKRLMEEAAAAIALHLQTLGEISQAVNHEAGTNLDSLLRLIQEHRVAELDSVQRYENHVAMHEAKARSAGASGAIE
jgi:hypothetical protein